MKKTPNPKRLLVEGVNDKHVLWALLQHHQVPESFEVRDKAGYENLRDTLDVELLGSGTQCIGILVDTDTNIINRWTSLRNVLIQSGYENLPTIPDPQGTIIQQLGKPNVGVWLMPNNQLPGMLEDFVQMLVPDEDTLWSRAELAVEQIPVEERLFPAQHEIKAKIHTWLAWQHQPGTPMGQAITNRYLSADTPQALLLIDWLRRLFNT